MKKRILFCLFFTFILSIGFISFVHAQLGSLEGQIGDARDNLEGNITKIKEFTDKDKWEFIGANWKEFLLKNKVIAGVDAFFTKINIVFVVLFARDWSISLEMFFVFLLWLFTAISLYGYFIFFKNKNVRWVTCILGAIALAQARVYYYISAGMYKLIFFKPSKVWNFAMFISCLVLLFCYYKINGVISKKLEENKKNKLQHLKDLKLQEVESFQKGLIKGEGLK